MQHASPHAQPPHPARSTCRPPSTTHLLIHVARCLLTCSLAVCSLGGGSQLAPAKVLALVEKAKPLRVPRSCRWKGLDLRAACSMALVVGTMTGFGIFMGLPYIQLLVSASDALCGGDVEFVATVDGEKKHNACARMCTHVTRMLHACAHMCTHVHARAVWNARCMHARRTRSPAPRLTNMNTAAHACVHAHTSVYTPTHPLSNARCFGGDGRVVHGAHTHTRARTHTYTGAGVPAWGYPSSAQPQYTASSRNYPSGLPVIPPLQSMAEPASGAKYFFERVVDTVAQQYGKDFQQGEHSVHIHMHTYSMLHLCMHLYVYVRSPWRVWLCACGTAACDTHTHTRGVRDGCVL